MGAIAWSVPPPHMRPEEAIGSGPVGLPFPLGQGAGDGRGRVIRAPKAVMMGVFFLRM